MLTIEVNGEKRKVQKEATVADLLADTGIVGRRVAVERNRNIVSRDQYESTPVQDGDVYEIVEFVGGG